MSVDMNARKEARKCLAFLRTYQFIEAPYGLFDTLRLHVRRGGCTLEDLGTSEEELTALAKSCHLAAARLALCRLREWKFEKGSVTTAAQLLADNLEAAGASLEFLDTTQPEIDECIRQGRIEQARAYLEHLRNSARHQTAKQHRGSASEIVDALRVFLGRAESSLEVIGTTEEELAKFLNGNGNSNK